MKEKATGKHARSPRQADYARSFRKDWERLSRAGRHNMTRLEQAMELLIANRAPLAPQWRDHPLKGDWAGYRECHIGGDFLLIYKLDDSTAPSGGIIFVRAGTHSEIFRE